MFGNEKQPAITRLEGKFEAIHGSKGNPSWLSPRLVVECNEEARPKYTSIKAHEYNEEPDVLNAKVKVLAAMIKQSKSCIAYTGAGISTSSGIPDYATRVQKEETPKKLFGLEARPTLSHHVLAKLYQNGFIKRWIQQNHDGLPQKAGFPQEAMNEIHGAWYDPSNPVVKMSGSLRDDLYEDLLEWERKADLCLTVGTSLSGMNADRVAVSTAKRERDGVGLGTVIITVQQTQYDFLSALRIFAKVDEVMTMLAKEMNIEIDPDFSTKIYRPPSIPEKEFESDMFMIPYDSEGQLNQDKSKVGVLDLREASRVKIVSGPYAGNIGVIHAKMKEGHFKIRIQHKVDEKVNATVPVVLGLWWIDAAKRGAIPCLPVVSAPPQ